MDQDADAELADRSTHDGQPVIASPVEHADVTVLTLGAGVDPPAVAINGVWPLRSRVMLSAPITIPSLGQSTRSLSRSCRW
jgi:hypothetical protein